MGELEDQIARLAQHRADQVPPYQAPASLSSARGRHRAAWFVAAAAIVTAIAVMAGARLWDRGDDPSVRTGPSPATEFPAPSTVPPTTPPSTASPIAACPSAPEATTTAKSGTGSVTQGPAVLAGVQILTSDCRDEVAFTFGSGLPNWSAEYRPGPLTLEPSGLPLEIEGSAFLVVRFEHGQGPRSDNGPPRELAAGPLSHVTQVRQTQDFEGIVTWVIGLDAQLPFTVSDRSDSDSGVLAIGVPELGDPRAPTCEVPAHHVAVVVPTGWYAELRDDSRCTVFVPSPDAREAVTLFTSPGVSAAGLLGSVSPSSTTSVATADGRTGSCVDGVYSGDPTRQGAIFVCTVPWGVSGTLVVTTNLAPGDRFVEFKEGVRALVASARYLP